MTPQVTSHKHVYPYWIRLDQRTGKGAFPIEIGVFPDRDSYEITILPDHRLGIIEKERFSHQIQGKTFESFETILRMLRNHLRSKMTSEYVETSSYTAAV